MVRHPSSSLNQPNNNHHATSAKLRILVPLLLISSATPFFSPAVPINPLTPAATTTAVRSPTPKPQRYRPHSPPPLSANPLPTPPPPTNSRRSALLGLLFPLAIAISANAPFLYVMANPPSAEERDAMLVNFCKGDVCTLLGGGSGFVGGGEGGEYLGGDRAGELPTVEEYEAMAARAAEGVE